MYMAVSQLRCGRLVFHFLFFETKVFVLLDGRLLFSVVLVRNFCFVTLITFGEFLLFYRMFRVTPGGCVCGH